MTNVSRTNAILLLLVGPIVLRFWVEAVVWRLQRGPQMLGFALAHGAAGWMTLPLLLSYLTIGIYALWVVTVLVRWAIPASRARIRGPHHVLLGGGCLLAFCTLSEYLQADISTGLLLLGAAALTVLVCAMSWLIYAGLR